MVASRTLRFRSGWVNVFPLLLSISAIVSACVSQAPYVSWIGSSNQEYTSVLTTLALCALFYVVVNTMAEQREGKRMFAAVLVSGGLVGLFSVLALCRLPVLPLTGGSHLLNTVGTLNALAVFLIIITIAANAAFVTHRRDGSMFLEGKWGTFEQGLSIFISACTLFVLLALDYRVLWIVLLVGLLIVFGVSLMRPKDVDAAGRFVLPFFLIVISLPFLALFPSPFPSNLPVEVTPSHRASLTVAIEGLKHSNVLVGTGPGTFASSYGTYHSQEVNQTQFWNTRFDRASSFLLNVLATSGVFGVVCWLVFIAFTALRGGSVLARAKHRDEFIPLFVWVPMWVTSVAALCLYSANMTLLTVFFVSTAMLASRLMPRTSERTFGESPRLGLAFSFLFVVVSTIIVTAVFVTTQRYLAEAAFAKAVHMDQQGDAELKDIVQYLDRAAQKNRFNDIYYRNLAQAFLLLVGKEVNAISSASEVTDQTRQYIQALTAASVNAGVAATNLAPHNVLNWLARAAIYRELVPLSPAVGDFAISSYEKAAALEPLNPAIQTELGKAHLVIAEKTRTLTSSEDADTAAKAQAEVDAHLASAEVSLNKAIALKGDYAPAHYQLGVLYERQGKLDEAIGKMESVMRYNTLDVGVAFQLGLLYLRRGDDKDLNRAQQALEYTVQLSPNYSNARWFLAYVYEQQKQFEKAKEQIQKVLEYNPDNELVKTRLERLSSGARTPVSTELPPTVEEGDQSATSVPEGQPTETESAGE